MVKDSLEMNDSTLRQVMTNDDLAHLQGRGAAFVSFGEVMIRDTPADWQRLEATRQVYLSPAGSEYTMALLLARLGVPAAYVSRLPDNPYGWLVRDSARGQGVDTSSLVWADPTEPIGRYLYELGRTPRQSIGWYQRKHSAASRLGPGMVDWQSQIRDCRILHTSGITFGLASHSGYDRNHLLDAFYEALATKPASCLVGLDFNYRATLWSERQCLEVMTPILHNYADILITSVYDMAKYFGIGCGQYSAKQIVDGHISDFDTAALQVFLQHVIKTFDLQVAAVTLRHQETFERDQWESAAMDVSGHFFRSPRKRSILVLDRLGGGDAWNSGFYYGLLARGLTEEGIHDGVLIGDAAARLAQTLMFDLAVISRAEIGSLLKADQTGFARSTVR